MGSTISNGGLLDGVLNGGKAVQGLDLTGSQATGKAIDAQTAAASQANETQKYIYDSQRQDLAPWQQAGAKALGEIQDNKFMDNWQQNDPGYQFRLDEGSKAIDASAAARGLSNSGATMKALTRYGQDYASNEYQNAYNRNYGRLSGLAGIGTNATGQQVQASGQYGAAVSGNQIGLGNGVAAANIGQSNRNGQLMGQGVGALAFCDERLKTDIEPVSQEDLAEMKSYLKAYYFNYKSNEHGRGNWAGVMAQDLQKSKLGRTLVSEDANGNLQVDMKKVMSVFLATMAEA